MDGDIVPWEKATVHVMTHSLHYGTAIFEGIRLYKTDSGPCIFRLDAHMKRLYNSTKIYGMSVPFTQEELEKGIKQLARENHIEECYIRPIVYYGWDEVGVDPTGNSVHARMEARKSGYQEAILLNAYGLVTEGTGENLFAVRDGTIFTPPLSSGILPGITRDSIIKICADLGLPVKEKSFTRGELLTSDEVFLVGTAAEVTPVREIDDRLVGSGTRGPITEKVQSKFFEVVRGKDPRYAAWLEPV